jgi:hypothetical protein
VRQDQEVRKCTRKRLATAWDAPGRQARSAAISLYVAHYNLCRVHESLRTTPAVQLRITDYVWSRELLDATLATQLISPTVTAPDGRRRFRVSRPGQLVGDATEGVATYYRRQTRMT